MTTIDPMRRTRVTKMTKARDAAMLALIGEMRTAPMTSPEIATFLGMSQSGARKYVVDLMSAGVATVIGVETGTSKTLQNTVYALSPHAEKVDRFVRLLSERDGGYVPPPRPVPRQPRISANSLIHTMSDDVSFKVKRASLAPPPRDPLVAALFGSTKKPA